MHVAKRRKTEKIRGSVLDLASLSTLDTSWLMKAVSSSLFRSIEKLDFGGSLRGKKGGWVEGGQLIGLWMRYVC